MITSVTLRVRPRPRSGRYEAWMMPSWEAGAEAYRELEQGGNAPDVARLSDARRPRCRWRSPASAGVKARAMGSYLACAACAADRSRSSAGRATRRRSQSGAAATTAVLRRHGGAPLGSSPGRAWAKGRFHAPYFRDELLGRGVMVETLETATTWSNLQHLYAAVREALGRHAPLVACHISHLYPSGSSLYFTFLAHQEQDDQIGQWQRAKAAACEAIVAAGGTITHHHAIGRDHREYLLSEDSAPGIAALRAAKAALDPGRDHEPRQAAALRAGSAADGLSARQVDRALQVDGARRLRLLAASGA